MFLYVLLYFMVVRIQLLLHKCEGEAEVLVVLGHCISVFLFSPVMTSFLGRKSNQTRLALKGRQSISNIQNAGLARLFNFLSFY